LYACPDDQKQAAVRVLTGEFGLWRPPGPAPGERYESDAVTEGTACDLRDALLAAAPGASFVMWEDSFDDKPGELCAYAPGLGPFGPRPCSGSNVLMTLDDIRGALDAAAPVVLDPGHARDVIMTALEHAMGWPWLDDWDRVARRVTGDRNEHGPAVSQASPGAAAPSGSCHAADLAVHYHRCSYGRMCAAAHDARSQGERVITDMAVANLLGAARQVADFHGIQDPRELARAIGLLREAAGELEPLADKRDAGLGGEFAAIAPMVSNAGQPPDPGAGLEAAR
jgi:hypothetical protein